MNKFYYTYLVYLTNQESKFYGHVYYGKHVTGNLADGYKGSGKIVQSYYKKYSNDYYFKILNFYNSTKELNEAEYDLIHPHLGQPYCLNLVEGGYHPYGNKFHLGHKQPLEARKKMSEANIGNKHHLGFKHNEEVRKLMGEKRKAVYWSKTEEERKAEYESRKGNTPWNKGMTMSEEYKHKLSLGHTRIITEEELEKRSNSLKGKNKGKHKVWDNKEQNKYHMEY